MVGPVKMGRFITAYSIGDRITAVCGRDLSLQGNATVASEGPNYPMVVGITWDFDGGQHTTLDLSSERLHERRRR
jgi:hypothetical protein